MPGNTLPTIIMISVLLVWPVLGDPAGDKVVPLDQSVSVETEFIKLTVSPTGNLRITDKQSDVTWQSKPNQDRWSQAAVRIDGRSEKVNLDRFSYSKTLRSLNLLHKPSGITLKLQILPDGRTLDLSYETAGSTQLDSINILEDALALTDTDKGCLLLPNRMGILIPTDSGVEFERKFYSYAYENFNMLMMGLVKKGSALLMYWQDPDVTIELKSAIDESGRQLITTTAQLNYPARHIRLSFLGQGDYTDIAAAYRQVARRKGWVVTWDEKIAENPLREKVLGAVSFRMAKNLYRRMSEDGSREISAHVGLTFSQSADVARHLKNDLALERVIFILGGWIRRGYDNQHPDILPAAGECGGNAGLARCSKEVKDLGYLFCLHDNYQGLYPGAPSWDKDLIIVKKDGELFQGSQWAGGRPAIMCSKKALQIAKRPSKNLPAVKALFKPNSYFIDTTCAVSLYDCYHPAHPLTKWGDMRYKQRLCDYARGLFGVFGTEDGKEWGIPHADFFEGIGGVRGDYFHN